MKFSVAFLAQCFWQVSLLQDAGAAEASPRVKLDYATYQGVSEPSGVTHFLGMRYAAIPIGNKRFRRPEDPAPESGVIQADTV